MSSIITFAANNDLFRKRKRVYRACESCKKRRKRCTHTFDDDCQDAPPEDQMTPHQCPADEPPGEEQSPVQGRHKVQRRESDARTRSRSRSTSPSRFIGNALPEAVFLTQDLSTRTVHHECGYWMPRDPNNRKSARSRSGLDAEKQALERYLAIVNVDLLPPQQHLDALLKIYFEYVHPFLPIVDSTRPGRRKTGELLSPMLLQAICIVACRHSHGQPHLVLSDNGKLMSPRDFAKRLYKSIEAALNAKLEHDRIVLIQVLTLLSLYVEGTDGYELASLHLSEAIHHAHTIGMQFGKARGDERADYFQDSFWCLWMLDKLNSIGNGRPLLMSDQDSRLDTPLANPKCKYTPFGIFLQIASALDHIIQYYRPRTEISCTGWEDGFPGFEEIIGDKGDSMDPTLLTFLELFYHAASIMSHKARPINEPVAATPSWVRQSLSTVRVIQILRDECPDDLPPLPIVPWAASLAMAHAYRVFRQSSIATHRNRAKNDLSTCCDLLDRMRSNWWSAGAMADLGRATLRKASDGKNKQTTDSNGSGMMPPNQNAGHAQPDSAVPTHSDAQTTSSVKARNADDTSPHRSTSHVNALVASPLPSDSVRVSEAEDSAVGLDPSISPDWLNFDTAFENFDAVLGSSGADVSMELLRPFNFEEFGSYQMPT